MIDFWKAVADVAVAHLDDIEADLALARSRLIRIQQDGVALHRKISALEALAEWA